MKLWGGYRVCLVRMYVRMFVHMFTFCHHCSDLFIIQIQYYFTQVFGYDSISNMFVFQRDGVKVKVAVTIKKKLCHHARAFIYRWILALYHIYV